MCIRDSIRGAAVPVFDLKSRFKKIPSAQDQKNVIILVKLNDKILGLLADAVSDILDYSLSDVQDSEITQSFISVSYTHLDVYKRQDQSPFMFHLSKLHFYFRCNCRQ